MLFRSFNSEPGFAELILDPTRTDVIQKSAVPNLSFIATGHVKMNPGDAFLSAEMDQLLARWRQEYDYILIDSSPVFAADDATTLAPKTDGVLFVVRSRFSRAKVVRLAIDLLHQRSAKVLGLIYNRADASNRSSYYYYNYEDYYGENKKNGKAEETKVESRKQKADKIES